MSIPYKKQALSYVIFSILFKARSNLLAGNLSIVFSTILI